MKFLLIILSIITLCSCSPSLPTLHNSNAMKDHSEFSIKEFAKVGQSTNCDIISKMNAPSEKRVYSNGKYAYTFIYNQETSSYLSSIFSRISIAKNSVKSVMFTFDSNNILYDTELNISDKLQVSKYKFMDIPQETEIEDVRKINNEKFLHRITLGMKKGVLFRLVGKPDISYDSNDGEKWIFQQINKRELAEKIEKQDRRMTNYTSNMFLAQYGALIAGTMNMFDNLADSPAQSELVEYVIVLKDNIVIDRYISKVTELTEKEKKCMIGDRNT